MCTKLCHVMRQLNDCLRRYCWLIEDLPAHSLQCSMCQIWLELWIQCCHELNTEIQHLQYAKPEEPQFEAFQGSGECCPGLRALFVMGGNIVSDGVPRIWVSNFEVRTGRCFVWTCIGDIIIFFAILIRKLYHGVAMMVVVTLWFVHNFGG